MSENTTPETFIPEVTCPKCGGHTFRESGVEDGMYICTNRIDGKVCDHTQYLCRTCNKIKDESTFGKHGDVWECKTCNTVCWPCTDRMRAIEEAKQLLSMAKSFKDLLKF